MNRADLSPYRLLDCPWVYRCSQVVLAPGAQRGVLGKVRKLVERLPSAERLLDVGCGPSSWLFRIGRRPIGVDCSMSYVKEYCRRGAHAIAASAEQLPVVSQRFDAVWSIFLLHHLPAEVARRAIVEMIRACRPGGYVVVLDVVLPRSPWRRPIPYTLLRLDRGGFVRREEELLSLLPQDQTFTSERFTYSLNGLELMACVHIKDGAA